MKKKGIKFFSLILAVMMVITCVSVAGVSVSAEGEVVYFDNSVTKFDTVKCFMWGSGSENAEWPGEDMVNVGDDIWAYTVTGSFNQVIFSDGETKSQDLIYTGGDKIAVPCESGQDFSVDWAKYSQAEETTAPETKAKEKKAKVKTGAGNTIYCLNEAGWSSVNCYMWNSDSDKNANWPGAPMKNIGDNVWEYTPTKSFKNIIFNDGGTQTGDMTVPSDKNLFNNKTNDWDTYSSSPVKITSFTSSSESPAYLGASILLSAVAKSDSGALTYKFSANGSVIYQGSNSSCAWVPTTVGNYTLKLDVTDTANNSNSKSISMEIKDASALDVPFIAAFSNSLKTNTQIKRGSAVTFTLGALGGKVGTNLLFYKFVVEDPDGNPNVPYYTRNNSYVVTPTKLGKYTITAYVQNSYNDTVEKTYEYTAVDNITEDHSDETTPVPTQAPTDNPIVTVTTPTPAPYTDGLMGDVDMDGNISVKDATAIQKKIALMPVSKFDSSVADVNHDVSINVKDATRIQMFVAKLISQF